jgi:hypothetical protein
MRGAIEQLSHFCIAGLGEVVIPNPHGEKRIGRFGADNFVYFHSESIAGFWRTNRNRRD